MLNLVKKTTRTVYPYQYSSLRRLLEPRQFQAYCVGINKSGTHSIANMFATHYRSSHEEDHGTLINGFLDWKEDKLKKEDFQSILLNHNKYAWLEMDSSHVHNEYVDLLVELFPEAKFILTIRDCYSWLDSHFNHCLNYPLYDSWARLHDWRYSRTQFKYSSAEQILQDYGFSPLESYFSAWATHNQRALNAIPCKRLLILRTSEISRSTNRIAEFLNIPESTLDTKTVHSFKALKKHHLLSQIDPECIREKAEKYCSKLMRKFFGKRDYLELLLSKNPKS